MSNVSLIDGHIDEPRIKDEDIIKTLERCINNDHCGDCPLEYFSDKCMEYRSNLLNVAFGLINIQKAEIKDLFYKLEGVMHSVDKWLDGDELKQDEVNRAATMREKTLQITEKQQAEIKRLKKDKYNLQKALNQSEDYRLIAKAEAIKDVLLTLEAEAESSDKYIREYDDSKEQRAYNQALWSAYNTVKEMVGE